MNVKLKITQRDRANFNKQIKTYTKKLGLRRSDVLDRVAEDIDKEASKILDSQGTSDTGYLKNSIKVRKTLTGERRVGTNTGYGMHVEFGRPPGTFPDVKHLRRWVSHKLGIKGEQADIVAYYIGKAIKERGTKAQPFMRPGFERGKTKLLKLMREQLIK